MATDPKRKTRLGMYLMIGIGGGFLVGCASREPAPAPVLVESPPSIIEKSLKPSERPTPPPARLTEPGAARSLRVETDLEKLPEEWIFRKPATARPSLSLFEESILLGQVRSTLKTLPEAGKVQTIKVQNRSALLGVTPEVTSGTAARIGDTLLKETRVEEVRIKPVK